MRAFITGVAGTTLTTAERQFVQEADPWGLILFKRNVTTPDALRRLIGEVRGAVGRQAPVLVDQEGGRVQRLRPPHWQAYPAGAVYGAVFDRDPDAGLRAARLGGRLIANDLAQLGIDVDCAPVADLPAAGARARGLCWRRRTAPGTAAPRSRPLAHARLFGRGLPVPPH